MKTIWKFAIATTSAQEIETSTDFRPLSVGMQGPEICLWAVVDPESPKRSRMVKIVGTGHPIYDDFDGFEHVGMVLDGPFVWHVFVEANR
jgi:hypothetical protein